MTARWLQIVLVVGLLSCLATGCGPSREKNRNQDHDRPIPTGRK